MGFLTILGATNRILLTFYTFFIRNLKNIREINLKLIQLHLFFKGMKKQKQKQR